MGKGMTVKNLFLGFVAVILTVCLIGLLILATNEDALAKVHKTINTLNAINVSTEDTYKKKMDILNIHTAKASEVNENVEKQNHFKHRVNANKSNSFNEQECQVIAQISISMIIMV
ncbi:exported protein [Staphylococcus aureus]|nr:exported protein [Staphylococcus aureus]